MVIPDTFSGFPPFSLPSARFDFSHPRDTSAVAATFDVFSGLSWTPEPFPCFSGVPLPSLLVVLATFFGVSFLGLHLLIFTNAANKHGGMRIRMGYNAEAAVIKQHHSLGS